MSPRKSPSAISVMLIVVLSFFLSAAQTHAFPTWIGVTNNTQRHADGNPGTFNVMMNQSYATLHASVGIAVNGAAFKEYAMTFDGKSGNNSKWTFTPAAVFPANASVKYYFRGWDDAGGNIYDGSAASGYSFVSMVPTMFPVTGDVDLFGTTISMGSWLDDLNRPILYLIASDDGTKSLVRFNATRPSSDWAWEHGTSLMMRLDSSHRLKLFDPANASAEVIVFDPNGPSPGVFVNGQRLLTASSASSSYLPIIPMQLSVGVNNSVGADALAVGTSVQATGHNAAAAGVNTIASGENSFAVGDHTHAQGSGQFVMGSYNLPQGDPNAPTVTDHLFVIGNGTDNAHRSNAVTVLRNGNVGIGTATPTSNLEVQGDVRVDGNVQVTGAVIAPPQGDLSMGEFTQMPTP